MHAQENSAHQLRPLIKSATVKTLFGGISDMTLWRWVQYRGFPKPYKIAGRNYWQPDDIEQWRLTNAA